MKTIKSDYFKLWDTREKMYFQTNGIDDQYLNIEDAIDHKWDYLNAGNYPDYPSTVIEIHAFKDGKFQYNCV